LCLPAEKRACAADVTASPLGSNFAIWVPLIRVTSLVMSY
jgi:hypothetical protein